MIEDLFTQIAQNQNTRAALSAIRAAIKNEQDYLCAKKLSGDGSMLTALLTAEDAKTRKNAAALLGDLGIEEAAGALYQAYNQEKTLFVRPALLQALKKTNAYPYLPKLKEQYDLLCAQEIKEDEKKHIREELRALEQILRQEGKEVRHTFTGWNRKYAILLTTNPKYADVTKEQLSRSAQRAGVNTLGVQAVVDSLEEVVKIRTFRDLLFPIALGVKLTMEDGPEAFGEAVAESKLLPILLRCHKEPDPFYFRIDLKGGIGLEERSRYTKRAAAVIEEKSGRRLLNAPEEYEFELRVLFDKNRRIHVFLRMATIPMERFSYRKEAIAASIHPSSAALFLALAKPYLKKNAQILDPCCGVGTMLVERHMLLPVREVYAIDVFGEAVLKARINAEAAGLRVNFIHKDYLDFKHGYLFDEIICNMPMRGKRTKEEQDAFYQGFFDKSQELIAPDGILLLYSNENGFIKKQLRLHPAFRLRKEFLISEKDQFYFYVIGTCVKSGEKKEKGNREGV